MEINMQDQTELRLMQKGEQSNLRLVSNNRNVYYFIKRIIDLVLASVMLLLFSPLMLVIATMIFLYSPGPIFFVQERVGAKRQKYGKDFYWEIVNFRCYKFRTMKINADSSIHQAYVKALIANDEQEMATLQGAVTEVRKLIRDSQIIRPGGLLRKLSLDELPQLWNVLRGEISLIGPRPAIPYEVEMYKPFHYRRLEAQPGISGLQQVTARCIADFDTQVRLDIEYIENQSLWLDFKIMLKTPLAILSIKGAN